MNPADSDFEALVKRQDEAHTSLSTQANLLSAQVQQILTHLVEDLPSWIQKPHHPGQQLDHHWFRCSMPWAFASLHQKNSSVSRGSVDPSLLTVKCTMNTTRQPSPQKDPRWHSWFRTSPEGQGCGLRPRGPQVHQSLKDFTEALRRVFDPITSHKEKA